ncbi:DUF11 domain-containing protein [Deinococcus knuensis]|uniref:DUF11 domain-containing protein n=1 Tax=Deinococcus knuensis TaxID=1837380 RepID=A0ABQ2SIF4_9DEIO|nr:DUF11 domain-containing protein [Deinococcus knuensis]GGS28184.1 hypothetical protein GCM10008961_19830 [Deinococcus knuensis]
MKRSTQLIALMAALAAGSASAAGTLAGTTIENTATASFEDPANAGSTLSSTSNTVQTVVLPKPDFDIVYTDGTTDGNTITTTPVLTTGAVPGQVITTPYSLVNKGNTPLDIVVNADTTGSAAGSTVKYYRVNPDGSLGAEIPAGTAVTVTPDDPSTPADEGIVKIAQVITLPTDPALITPTSVFGASPEGTVVGTAGADPLVTPGNGYASGTTIQEENKAVNTDLQFTRITVYAPALDNNPNTNPGTPVDSAGNPLPPASVPPVTSVSVPTEVVGKVGDNTPVVSAPGYITPAPTTPPATPSPVPGGATDPTPGGTPIATNVAGDEQIAYPAADTNTTPDKVVFTNTLTNTGGATDKVQLFPALADGTPDPAYTFDPATGVFTNTATGVTIRFLDPVTGEPIKVSVDPTNPTVAQYPTVTVPDGSTVVYRTEVTYPDANDSAPIAPISVVIGADSLKDAGLVSNSNTKNTILPPAAQFGDATGTLGAAATPAPVQTVNPNGVNSGISSPDFSDATATFPMDVVNNGQYNDSYTLSGTVTLTDAVTGNPVVVPVLYYAPDGSLLPRVSTDPASPDYNKFITPVVAPGTEYKPVAVIQVPAGTLTGDYTVTQNAVGNYSTIPMTDTNNIIRVAPAGSVAVAKFIAKAGVVAGTDPKNGIDNPTGYTASGANGAKPGDTLSYRIIGKNTYNTDVNAFFLSDTVPANTSFASVALNPAPVKTIYRVDGGAWSATAPAAGLAAGTVIDVAVDADGNNLPDALAPGATLTADFTVTVN